MAGKRHGICCGQVGGPQQNRAGGVPVCEGAGGGFSVMAVGSDGGHIASIQSTVFGGLQRAAAGRLCGDF